MAKKSLGQNFLKSTKALGDIISAGKVSAKDTILEIGPGKGALTEKLLEAGAKVLAVEADIELILVLQEKFAKEISDEKLELVHADILETSARKLKLKNYKIIANIPYYITGAIIRKFLEEDTQPELMVLLVQKEVAERIVARGGKQSILSMSVQAYGEPKMIGKVAARYFTPAPRVDSAIILIDNISKKKFKNVSEKDFFALVKIAFGQKRKTLIKNLGQFFARQGLAEKFACLGISENARAEDLDLNTMILLTQELFPQKTE